LFVYILVDNIALREKLTRPVNFIHPHLLWNVMNSKILFATIVFYQCCFVSVVSLSLLIMRCLKWEKKLSCMNF